MENQESIYEEKQGNLLTGILGALLGALIGTALWVLVGVWGYIAGIVAWLTAFLAGKGYDLLLCTEDVDEFVPQTLMTYMEKPFCNVSTEDLGLQTEEEKKQAEEKAEEMKGLLTFVKETLGDQVKEVKLSSELGSHPVCMTPAEGMSFEMEKYMKRANPEFAFPVGRVLELNPEHEAVQAMQKAMTEDPEKAKDYAKLLCYQAQLMAELPLDDPYAYTELVCRLMK